MSDMLSIGSSGVTAYQRALTVVSNNIANVSTEGYSRQDVQIASNQPTMTGGSFIGTGSSFDRVRRQYDAFVETNLRNCNSELKSQEPLLTYSNRLINIMGDQSIGLTTALNSFFQSARDLSSDAASTIQRSIFLRNADGLATRFRQLSSQFDSLDSETHQAVDTTLGKINSLTSQLAGLNKQLNKKADESAQPSELLDQRENLLRQLADLISIKTKFSKNGSVLVSVGDTLNQGILVNDISSRSVSAQMSASDIGKIEFTIDPYGKPESLPYITSGELGGLIQFRDQVLIPARNTLDNLAKTAVNQSNLAHHQGIDAEGKLGQDLFTFTAGLENTAAGMKLALQDESRIAAAGLFRVIDDPLNPGSAQGRIEYATPSYKGPTGLANGLQGYQVPALGKATLTTPSELGYATVGLISAGTKDATITLKAPFQGKFLQVLTRDGVHLLGSELRASNGSNEISKMIKADNGMELGATYDTEHLSQTGSNDYMGMDLFLGAKAMPIQTMNFNPLTGEVLDPIVHPPELLGGTLGTNFADAINRGNVFTLNGVVLRAPATGSEISNSDGINGIVAWLNSQSDETGVHAENKDGSLLLTRVDESVTGEIRLGVTPNGSPADMAQLGFETTFYARGTSQDDLLVFVSDRNSVANSNLPVNVTAQTAGQPESMRQILRNHPLEVKFNTKTDYQIVDTLTGDVLAKRTLSDSAVPQIHFRGLILTLSNLPEADDVYRIDGNKDGIGNNEAMLKLVDLEEAKVMSGGLTMTESYIEGVNKVGNIARQADISKQALTVVQTQALQAHDSISGVSLDEEASALVKFQQAYQANAKVMQLASTLFDTILRVG